MIPPLGRAATHPVGFGVALNAYAHTIRAMPRANGVLTFRASNEEQDSDSDEVLMRDYAAGRAAAFDQLYLRHKGGVYRYLLRHCGNSATADELFQEIWMKVIRVRVSYVPTAKFTTWLYTLAHHRMVDHWRTHGQVKLTSADSDDATRETIEALPAPSGDEPEAQRETVELRASLRTALATLPSEQRDAFLLQQEAGLSLAEIAELTGAGLETVKSRLRYAVAKLRAELAPLREALR